MIHRPDRNRCCVTEMPDFLKDTECEAHEMNQTHMVEDPSRGMINFALNFKRNWGPFLWRNGNGGDARM